MIGEQERPDEPLPYGGAYNGALIDSAVHGVQPQDRQARCASGTPSTTSRSSESYATLPTNGFPWDAYHINSISLSGKGTFLVSMRDTWAAYLVDIQTGKIEWTLGGKHSSFSFGPEAAFQWQHDVKFGPGSTVTAVRRSLLPDHRRRNVRHADRPARGLVLKLDAQAHKATLAAQYGTGREPRPGLHGQHPAAARRERVRRLGR